MLPLWGFLPCFHTHDPSHATTPSNPPSETPDFEALFVCFTVLTICFGGHLINGGKVGPSERPSNYLSRGAPKPRPKLMRDGNTIFFHRMFDEAGELVRPWGAHGLAQSK